MKPVLVWCLIGALILGLPGCVAQEVDPSESLQLMVTDPTEIPKESGTERPTAHVTEPPTEAPTEAPTEVPTEPPTEAPTEVPTEPPTQPPTAAPTEPPTQPPTEPEALETETDPLQPVNWVVRCNNYLVLRTKPSTSASGQGRLYPGDKVVLLGWEEKFAKVRFKGKEGYILAGYIQPIRETYLEDVLQTVPVTAVYTHGQMLTDLQSFVSTYPELAAVEVLGQSAEGRDIPVLRLGKEDAMYHVLLHGSIHGREHITTWLLMALADHQLSQGLPEDICFHIIPMVNPDGVHISQTGTLNDAQKAIYQRDRAKKYTDQEERTYASRWKANGQGIDLNRSFSAGWEKLKGRQEPSSELYPGTQPFDAVEAQLLRDYTTNRAFAATISMHSTGSIIYYDYGKKEPVNGLSKSFALAVRELTGYRLVGQSTVDGAGYKDWVIEELEIPSLTLEIGCLNAPIARRELESIFARCYDLLPVISHWVEAQ